MKITVMDTTLRDGEQTSGVSFTYDEKLSMAKLLLEELKVDRLEVASARVLANWKQCVKLYTGPRRTTIWKKSKCLVL
jgi:D-citramalate synthase